MSIDQVKNILKNAGKKISKEERTGNAHGTKLTLECGGIVNVYDTGTVNCQGKNAEELKPLFHADADTVNNINKKVFVVYGHDQNARTQLEAMLRRWELEPVILDQLVSSGQTIIEKLEENISDVGFGIVLATPDDKGHAKGRETESKYRARQNVILELGMLLAKIGRPKTAILLSQQEEMEKPSDIQGLIYIPFKDNVEETGKSLAKEMHQFGYKIDIGKL